MFIQTEPTTDPDVLRFRPGRNVIERGTMHFSSPEAARRSPLAAGLFGIDGVTYVGFGADYVAVGKSGSADWQVLKPHVIGLVMDHFVAGRPILEAIRREAVGEKDSAASGPSDLGVIGEIERILEERIRPALEGETTEVALDEFNEGVAKLSIKASELSQPFFTLRVKMENTLRHYVPQVSRVELIRQAAETEGGGQAAGTADGLNTPAGVAITALLEERINPMVAMHGGRISLVDVKENTAFIRLEGGCHGCGMSDVTLKQGVEMEILGEVPGITEVRDVTDHTSGENPYIS